MVVPVTQRRRINLDEASTVEEDLGTHVTQRDELGAVLKVTVVLFENLLNNARMVLVLVSMTHLYIHGCSL